MSNQSHLKAVDVPAESSPPDSAAGDKGFLVFLTVIFAAVTAVVLTLVLTMDSPAVAGTSATTAVPSAQPAQAEPFVPFHERYGAKPGQPEIQPPTF